VCVLYETCIERLKMHTYGAAIPRADIPHLEDYNMHRANRYITSLFLTAALAAPVALMAIPAPQEDHNQNRVYDKEHKDYHNWDGNENKAWGQYLSDNHKSSHEYSKANKKEQSDYWNYRHAHPDKE
jgi:hypothetical protein